MDKRVKHGMYGTRIYRIWAAMKRRCNNKHYFEYELYGGRGITHCAEWNEFSNFHEWAMQNGYEDKLTIDRIDNEGSYSPQNCRWITPKEQANNRRSNIEISYKGKTMNLMQWSFELGMQYKSLHKRLKNGWSVEETFTRPLKINS